MLSIDYLRKTSLTQSVILGRNVTLIHEKKDLIRGNLEKTLATKSSNKNELYHCYICNITLNSLCIYQFEDFIAIDKLHKFSQVAEI